MGILRAISGSVGGTLADSWLEYITSGYMDSTTLMTRGIPMKRSRRGKKSPGSSDIISNGSRIEVGPNQMMILIDSGRIVDYTAQEGCYEVYLSDSPSMFNGELDDTIRETFERFKFGGIPGKSQRAFFINLQEIRGIKFGTHSPLQYFDQFYNAELFLRCHGTFSIKITDPLQFFMEVGNQNSLRLTTEALGDQFQSEFLTALQSAIVSFSASGERVSTLPSKSTVIAKYMSTALNETWKKARGIQICSVGISGISYDDESKNLINLRNRGAMMSDPTVREGYVQTTIANGLGAAGSNPGGSTNGFVGMNLGMQATGGFMASASAANAAQMQQQQSPQSSDNWRCACGATNTGKFCTNCGKPKPENTSWRCSCGAMNTGKFCTNCGKPKPENTSWRCSCGATNTGKFCTNCGKPRP